MKGLCRCAFSFGASSLWHPSVCFIPSLTKTGFAHTSASVRVVSGKKAMGSTPSRIFQRAFRPMNGHTPRKLPARRRQSLASSHIRLVYYNIFWLILQYLFIVYFVELRLVLIALNGNLHKNRLFTSIFSHFSSFFSLQRAFFRPSAFFHSKIHPCLSWHSPTCITPTPPSAFSAQRKNLRSAAFVYNLFTFIRYTIYSW